MQSFPALFLNDVFSYTDYFPTFFIRDNRTGRFYIFLFELQEFHALARGGYSNFFPLLGCRIDVGQKRHEVRHNARSIHLFVGLTGQMRQRGKRALCFWECMGIPGQQWVHDGAGGLRVEQAQVAQDIQTFVARPGFQITGLFKYFLGDGLIGGAVACDQEQVTGRVVSYLLPGQRKAGRQLEVMLDEMAQNGYTVMQVRENGRIEYEFPEFRPRLDGSAGESV